MSFNGNYLTNELLLKLNYIFLKQIILFTEKSSEDGTLCLIVKTRFRNNNSFFSVTLIDGLTGKQSLSIIDIDTWIFIKLCGFFYNFSYYSSNQ